MENVNYLFNDGQVYCKTTMQKCPIDDTVTGRSCPYCGNNPNNLFKNGSDGMTFATSLNGLHIQNVTMSTLWNLPCEKLPERVKENHFYEETAQEVVIQYVRAKRYELCVGWYEDGKWWCNDEEIQYPVVAWRKLPEKYRPEVQWEFEEWAEKANGEAFLIGTDDNGVEYKATGIYFSGEVVEVREEYSW